jgi:DNA polymerase
VNRDGQIVEHLRFAAELGVRGTSRDRAWRTRADAPVAVSPALPEREEEQTPPGPSATPVVFHRNPEALESIRLDIGDDCQRCKLHGLGRRQVVFGSGNPAADLMFIGEAPGADEDEQGVPFVGRAGHQLTKIIAAIGLTRDDVYIANLIKCRPPGNRNPEPDEVATCEPFLFRQIDAIAPRVIVTLGKFSTQALLRTDTPISRLRGRPFDYRGAKLVPTFHPAYVLRNNTPNSEVRRQVWEDMKLVKSLLQSS